LKKRGLAIQEAPSTEMNLKKLFMKRITAAALQDVTADNIIESHPSIYGMIKKIKPPLVTKPYYLMLSHKFVEQYPKLAQKIWDTIKIIRESEFDKIVLKYAGS